MLPTIRSLTPYPDYHLRLIFDDGETVWVDFKPVINQGGVFAPLADPDFFAQAATDERGRAIQWPGEIDFCADAFRPQVRAESEENGGRDRATELLEGIGVLL